MINILTANQPKISKKLFKVKFKYFSFEYENNFKHPACFSEEFGEFFFNWSTETAKQFARHLLMIQPSKYFISSSQEIEAISNKKEIFQKILDKTENKKIDKFELISIVPFIVESNFDLALSTTLFFFCIENESENILTRNELGLFIDSYFRCLHNIIILDDVDEIYEKTKNNVVRLSDNDIEELLNLIYDKETEMKLEEVIKKFTKNKICNFMRKVNQELYNTFKYYENLIKEKFKK